MVSSMLFYYYLLVTSTTTTTSFPGKPFKDIPNVKSWNIIGTLLNPPVDIPFATKHVCQHTSIYLQPKPQKFFRFSAARYQGPLGCGYLHLPRKKESAHFAGATINQLSCLCFPRCFFGGGSSTIIKTRDTNVMSERF